MNSEELEYKKRQMVESARKSVENIQTSGRQDRTIIQNLKNTTLHEMERYSQQEEIQQTIHFKQRSQLLQQLSAAAQSGDLAEMQRLKAMLAETSSL